MNTCKNTKIPQKDHPTAVTRQSASVIQVRVQMHSTVLKIRLYLQLYDNNFGLKQLSTTVKNFH